MDSQLIYPAPLFVRNTFIDCMEARPPSLEEFLQERLVKSCPTSGVADFEKPEKGDDHQMPQNAFCTTRRSGTAPNGEGDSSSECSTTDTAAGIGGAAPPLPSDVVVLDLQAALLRLPAGAPQLPAAAAAAPAPAAAPVPAGLAVPVVTVGRLAAGPAPEASAAGPAPEQQQQQEFSGELPSAGSAAHFAGRCKPCAFVNSKGCSIGKDCQFCHICEPGEKKRRQKEKRSFFSTMRRLQKNASENWPSVQGWR